MRVDHVAAVAYRLHELRIDSLHREHDSNSDSGHEGVSARPVCREIGRRSKEKQKAESRAELSRFLLSAFCIPLSLPPPRPYLRPDHPRARVAARPEDRGLGLFG